MYLQYYEIILFSKILTVQDCSKSSKAFIPLTWFIIDAKLQSIRQIGSKTDHSKHKEPLVAAAATQKQTSNTKIAKLSRHPFINTLDSCERWEGPGGGNFSITLSSYGAKKLLFGGEKGHIHTQTRHHALQWVRNRPDWVTSGHMAPGQRGEDKRLSGEKVRAEFLSVT